MRLQFLLLGSIFVTVQVVVGQTTYTRRDGGLTVVEKGKDSFGNSTTEVRRYANSQDHFQGEYATELALAQMAIQIAIDAAPHVEQTLGDLSEKAKAECKNAIGAVPDLRQSWEGMSAKAKVEYENAIGEIANVGQSREKTSVKPEQGSVAVLDPIKPFVQFPLVSHVGFNTVAEKAGLRGGDFIISYDGHYLGWANETNNPLLYKIERTKPSPSTTCEIIIFRNGTCVTAQVPPGVPLGVAMTQGPLTNQVR